MEKFKDLIRKYPEVFYLPGSPLNEIRGFTHFINTRNARPIYRLPYKKSPAEIKALRDEIERMLTMQIRACSHEPGTVNYPGVMIAPGQALPRVHMMMCWPGATLPRGKFIII